MNYKEKYNKLVEAVKELQEANPSDEGLQNWVNDNVPELKWNDDEKVRKKLIKFFETWNKTNSHCSGVSVNKILAWLEKQKEFVSEDFDDVWETADCDELTAPLEKYSKDAIKKMCHAWYDKGIELERRNWLEKQGEQKPQGKSALEAINEEKVDNSNRVEPKDYNSIDPHFAKPADKVEPKFEIGDTIINIHHRCDGNSRIREIKDGKYIFDDGSYIVIKEQDSWELVDKNKPKFKVGDTMRTLQEASSGITSGLPVVVSIDNEYYHCNNELIAIKDQNNYEYPPMNKKHNAWGKEDEYWSERLLGWLNTLINYIHYDSMVSLDLRRERIQQVEQIKTWLKSLKERYTWKPSNEQMAVLNEVINYAANSELQHWSNFIYTLLKSLREQLKKLK